MEDFFLWWANQLLCHSQLELSLAVIIAWGVRQIRSYLPEGVSKINGILLIKIKSSFVSKIKILYCCIILFWFKKLMHTNLKFGWLMQNDECLGLTSKVASISWVQLPTESKITLLKTQDEAYFQDVNLSLSKTVIYPW